MTPEIANLAQQQIAKQNFQERGQGLPQPQQNASPSAVPHTVSQGQPSGAGFATPEQISEYKKNLLQEPSYQQTYDLANQYLNQGITQDPGQAMQLAGNELKQNRTAQQVRNLELKKDFDERIKLDLQGSGLGDYKDVAGQIQKDLVDQGAYMVNALGMSPEQASEKISAIALELGKSANNLKDTGSFWNQFRKSSTKTTELKEQKKEFEKYGFGELFDDMVVGEVGITPLQAAHVLDPLKNKSIETKMNKFKDQSKKAFKTPFSGKMKEKELDDIIKSITPKDNLFSIEYLLRQKGFDVNQFKKRVQELESEKEIALTPQQKRQQKRAISSSILGDILYQSF